MSAELQQISQLKAQVAKLEEENNALRGSVETKGKIKCIIGNVDEYAEELDRLLPDADGDGKIDKLAFGSWIDIANTTWAKIKETRLECYGKHTVVELPDGWIGSAVGALLSLLKIRL